ncbi:MAG: TonB-dependent receptor [Flavisolibacter sp.]|jgi:iron complex outermembrane receptor protein|nr:TonB-dependent receptor [Flavisolibacter sp.]
MKFLFTVLLFFIFGLASAQQQDSITVNNLEQVVIKAFEQTRHLKDVPAAVNFINKQTLERFSPTSIVQAINTTPGVRMEERSPGSYRFNIRGSSLRSPFGVRNVKVYYNDIPFTDPGGTTYLNGLGYYNFNSVEIIKGPGSSFYGSGNGGVLLIESMDPNAQGNIFTEYTTGSNGLKNEYASITTGDSNAHNQFGFQHQQSEGYRNHSGLERNIFSWSGRFSTAEKNYLKTTFLYSDLFYETPGALTKAEYELNPRLSRPGGGGFPGAEQSKAAIKQKTFLAGLSYHQQFSEAIANTSTAYGMFTELRNPAIRNYGKNVEPHAGGRTVFSYKKLLSNGSLNLTAGGEMQQSFSTVSVYKNKDGNPDTLQTQDDIPTRQALAFFGASLEKKGWEFTVGGSLNFLNIEFKRSTPTPLPLQNRSFTNEFAPRVSVSKKWRAITVYSSVAKGFSPPTSAELSPSGSAINLGLNAEEGTSYDLGFRGTVLNDLNFDVNAFSFSLTNAIVQRRDAGGGELFINAGKTLQRGIETSINYPFVKRGAFAKQGLFWFSHTYHHFNYKEFKQLTSDFSGKSLPGIAPHTISTGVDFVATNGLLANLNYYYSDKLPLSDANNEYAAAYHLLNAQLGFEKWLKSKWRLKLVAGAENLLDETYSLGPDINAFGGRYYNAAPGRSYYVSLAVQLFTKNRPD